MVGAASYIRSGADSLINKYILHPKGGRGINGFVFDAQLEETTQFQSDITDHYVEDNFAAHDHVAIQPIRLKLQGLVGELVYNTNPSGVLGLLNTAQTLLTTVPAYLGKYTPKGLQDIQKVISKGTSVVNKIDNYMARAKNIVGLFTGGATETAQQKAYGELKEMWANREMCSVETPYEYFDGNMIIESIRFQQGEDSKFYSSITVSLKEIRVTQVSLSPVNKMTTSALALPQRQEPTDAGKIKGTPTTFGSKLNLGYRLSGGLPQ